MRGKRVAVHRPQSPASILAVDQVQPVSGQGWGPSRARTQP